jgi:hypothetical protein
VSDLGDPDVFINNPIGSAKNAHAICKIYDLFHISALPCYFAVTA